MFESQLWLEILIWVFIAQFALLFQGFLISLAFMAYKDIKSYLKKNKKRRKK